MCLLELELCCPYLCDMYICVNEFSDIVALISASFDTCKVYFSDIVMCIFSDFENCISQILRVEGGADRCVS